MGQTLTGVAYPAGYVPSSSPRYVPALGGRDINAFLTETNAQFKTSVAGTFSYLQALYDNVGTARSATFRKNAANGNLVITPTDTTAGLYVDSTHSDTVASGDLIDIAVASTGLATIFNITMVFSATAGHSALFDGGTGNFPTASQTKWMSLVGTGTSTIEANEQSKMRIAGTLKNAQCNVTTNARTTSSTLTTRKNGAAGSISMTIGAGLTGIFEDTVNTDTIASGDLMAWQLVNGLGTGSLSLFPSCVVTSTSGVSNDIGASGQSVRAAGAGGTFQPIIGAIADSYTEANCKIRHGFALTANKLRAYVSANTYTGSATLVTRINGANGAQSVAIGAGLTGWFEDTTNTDTFAATDDVNCQVTGGTSGSMTFNTIMMTEIAPTGAVSTYRFFALF